MTISPRSFFLIQQINHMVRKRLDSDLQSENLTGGQYVILNLLGHREPVSSAELARLTNMTAQSMGEFIKALEAKGLVHRQEDPTNRRIILIQRTSAGREALARCEAVVDDAEATFFDCLDQEELKALRLALDKLRRSHQERDNGSDARLVSGRGNPPKQIIPSL